MNADFRCVLRIPRTRAGFGLVELMIVIAIIAILAAIALPSYQDTIRLNRVTTDANDFLSALNTARNEAISRGRPVSICASVDGLACDGVDAADWSGGWIVFTDFGTTGVVQPGGVTSDTILRLWDEVNTNVTLMSGGIGYVTFGRTGTAKIGDGEAASTAFVLKPQGCSAQQQRRISVAKLGRATVSQENCS